MTFKRLSNRKSPPKEQIGASMAKRRDFLIMKLARIYEPLQLALLPLNSASKLADSSFQLSEPPPSLANLFSWLWHSKVAHFGSLFWPTLGEANF
jgi:hypothetical protein